MNRRRKKSSLSVLVVVLLLIIVLIGCGIRLLDSAVFSDNRENGLQEESEKKTITVDGVDYYPRQDITVILAMGIDTEGEMADSGSYNNDGEADVVSLIIFDELEECCTVLNLNRDSMVDMPVLGVDGRKAGTAYQQLALSHTYGSGLEDSCENTKETVSKLLNNIYIDYYIAANMDAIAIANDAVGGVTVNVTDDFSGVTDTIPMGQVTLKGRQATSFVRMRKDVGDQLNISRMERHKEYIDGFMQSLRAKRSEGDSFIYSMYADISPYIVTDLSANALSGMYSRYEGYQLKDIISPKGENVRGKQYMEFYLDREALDNMILDVFYKEK